VDEEKLTPFHIIGHDIKIAIDNGAVTGALILTYAAIDAMAYLSMPANKKEVHRTDFINWVERYMKTDSKQPYQYEGLDLYSARCGLVHRFGATSRLSDSGKCKIFVYHNGGDHIYNPSRDEGLVFISSNRFIYDFFNAMENFIGDIMKDREFHKKVEERIVTLFNVMSIKNN